MSPSSVGRGGVPFLDCLSSRSIATSSRRVCRSRARTFERLSIFTSSLCRRKSQGAQGDQSVRRRPQSAYHSRRARCGSALPWLHLGVSILLNVQASLSYKLASLVTITLARYTSLSLKATVTSARAHACTPCSPSRFFGLRDDTPKTSHRPLPPPSCRRPRWAPRRRPPQVAPWSFS